MKRTESQKKEEKEKNKIKSDFSAFVRFISLNRLRTWLLACTAFASLASLASFASHDVEAFLRYIFCITHYHYHLSLSLGKLINASSECSSAASSSAAAFRCLLRCSSPIFQALALRAIILIKCLENQFVRVRRGRPLSARNNLHLLFSLCKFGGRTKRRFDELLIFLSVRRPRALPMQRQTQFAFPAD